LQDSKELTQAKLSTENSVFRSIDVRQVALTAENITQHLYEETVTHATIPSQSTVSPAPNVETPSLSPQTASNVMTEMTLTTTAAQALFRSKLAFPVTLTLSQTRSAPATDVGTTEELATKPVMTAQTKMKAVLQGVNCQAPWTDGHAQEEAHLQMISALLSISAATAK